MMRTRLIFIAAAGVLAANVAHADAIKNKYVKNPGALVSA